MTPPLRVHSIESCGTTDGPGVRTIIFLQGCFFRCLYCHNPDTWDLRGGTEMSHEQIWQRIEPNLPYFGKRGGVTVSGGEPLVQREGLISFFTFLHERGVRTALDTNGSFLDDAAKHLLQVTDIVILDVKHIRDDKHRGLTGMSNATTLAFAQYCEDIGKDLWLRYVLVPGHTDDLADVIAWADAFTSYRHIKRVEILPYHTYGAHKYTQMGLHYPLAGVKRPAEVTIRTTLEIMRSKLPHVVVH